MVYARAHAQVCGSDYDEYGNERFAHPRAMRAATFLPEFMFGYPSFDWIFPAFLTIFECITLESWAEIMYMVRAAPPPTHTPRHHLGLPHHVTGAAGSGHDTTARVVS